MHRGSSSILKAIFLGQPAYIILWIIVYMHIHFPSNQYLQGCPGIQGNTVTLSGAGYPCYFDLKKCSWKLSYFSFSLESENPSHAWYLLYFSVHHVHGVDRTQGPQGSRRTNITVSQVLLLFLCPILKRMCSKVSAEIWRRERRLSAHSEGLFENRVWEKNTTPWYSLCQTIITQCNNDHTCQIVMKIREGVK